MIAISAGNHAQAVAFAAAAEGIDALVVMWEGASAQKIAATRGYGAAVDLEASGPGEAFDRLRHADRGDRPDARAPVRRPARDRRRRAPSGSRSKRTPPTSTRVIVPVGGGGLIGGIQAAIGDRVRVIAVEPELSTAFHSAVAAGEPVPVTPSSIADGLSAPFAGRIAIETCKDLERVLVTEEEIEHAFRFLYERAKLACEPAGAVATAAWLAGKIDAANPVILVSGGNVAGQTAAAILARP